jgi:SAM-dependent methyltransferase
MPGGQWLYRAIQLHVTDGHFLTVTQTLLRLHLYHVAQYQRVHPGRAIEFGGGRGFLTPLLLSHAGATEILVYDIERLSSAPQINHTIRQLRSLVPGDWPEISDCEADLQRKYRIKYVAPGDAGDTGLPEASVSFVCSTSTLEHIPAADIERILRECIRVAAPGAIFSHVVDYKDHYVYADPSVSMFNFYQFSERQWRWWNPSNHFQNRLRHSDYEKMFARLGLTCIDGTASQVAPETIASLSIAPLLSAYSRSDLLTDSAYFVLQRS